MHHFRNARDFLRLDRRKITILSAFIALPVFFYFVTHSPVSSASLGLVSAIFLASALTDARTGKIPNGYMIAAACLSVLLQMSVNGALGGLIRSTVVVVLWAAIASLWYSRKTVGGGDLKMIGITWLVLAAFPLGVALYLTFIWALALSLALAIAGVVRKAGLRHFRAGLLLALCAIFAWTIGLL